MQKSTIALSIETKNRLKALGKMNQSYEKLVIDLLDRVEEPI